MSIGVVSVSAMLVKSLGAAGLQGQIDGCFTARQLESLFDHLFLGVVAIIVEVFEDARIVSEMLIVVLNNDTCRL